jgi:DNA-binding NarL/FixJ family response regulator
MKNILLCDDHLLFATSLSNELKRYHYNVDIAFEIVSCEKLLKENKYDVFICDLNIKGGDGFDLLSRNGIILKNTRVLFLTAYYEPFLIDKAKRFGVHGFLRKDICFEKLLISIESTEDQFQELENNDESNFFTEKDKAVIKLFKLSKQEKQIIKLIVGGKTSQEIAEILFISKNTVDTHRSNINKKLEVSNVASLIHFANLYNIL